MKPAVVLLVGENARAELIAREAASIVFGQATIETTPCVERALGREVALSTELLVLVDPVGSDAKLASEATDSSGLRRWPIVSVGSESGAAGFEAVPLDEWNPSQVARSFRSALKQFEIVRENERFRGDLQSIARRISHDLRVQMGAIVTSSEVLREFLAEQAPPGVKMLAPIFDATNAQEKLLKRVSFVLRASANAVVIERVGMGGVVIAALERLEMRVRKLGAAVVQPESWPMVDGVASWLETVWNNLISNALEHCGEAPKIELGWRREGKELHFWVRDHGPGVAPERRRKLFQPFHLLYDPGALCGLGLPICRRLMELQGGRCGYEPAIDAGSCFSFYLPVDANEL